MLEPKKIVDVTISDLEQHRWCYYHNDEFGFDCFEYVVSELHPEFSEEIIELELATFEFPDGTMRLGMFDGSNSFTVALENESVSFWYGVNQPDDAEIENVRRVLSKSNLTLPVLATAKWSKEIKSFNGLQYIDKDGVEVEIAI